MSAPGIVIEKRPIGTGHPAFIIAEIGVNHNGDPELAHRMIDEVADSGCDCVKFQTFSAEEFCNNPDDVYEYISQGNVVRESMLEMFRRLELKREEFAKLFSHARTRGLVPMSTPADRAAVDLLIELGVEAFKVGSDDLVYSSFLEYVASKNKPVIISTGMASLEDVERAAGVLASAGNKKIVILHCVSLYPTPESQVNLRRITTLASEFPEAVIGFSDHSWGIRAALGAISLGAAVIEKHFTLDNDLPGPDHRFSANPQQLRQLVSETRLLESQLGSGRFELSLAEQQMADLCHRSIVASRTMSKGEVLSERDFAYRRPGNGLMPYRTNELIGRRLKSEITEGVPLSFEMLEQE